MTAAHPQHQALHMPVLLREVVTALAPIDGGTYLDATFGNGGYTGEILNAAACAVIAIDRDPDAIARGAALVESSGGRLTLHQGVFSDMRSMASPSILVSAPHSLTSRSAAFPSALTDRSTCACRKAVTAPRMR